MDHKRHHWVPKSYLDAWLDPNASPGNGQVWVFSKDGTLRNPSATVNLFRKRDLYTRRRQDGSRDLSVETGLLHCVETNFVPVREKVARREPLTDAERLHLCAFVATMLGRPLSVAKSVAGAFQDLKGQIDKIATSLHKQFGDPEDPDPLASLKQDPLYAEIAEMVSEPAPAWVAGAAQVYLPVLARMRLTMLRTNDSIGFITSDSPCMLRDADVGSYPPFFRSPQIGSPKAEVTLPLSPGLCVHFSWGGKEADLTVAAETLGLVNALTCAASAQHVVVCRNEFRPDWQRFTKPTQAGS